MCVPACLGIGWASPLSHRPQGSGLRAARRGPPEGPRGARGEAQAAGACASSPTSVHVDDTELGLRAVASRARSHEMPLSCAPAPRPTHKNHTITHRHGQLHSSAHPSTYSLSSTTNHRGLPFSLPHSRRRSSKDRYEEPAPSGPVRLQLRPAQTCRGAAMGALSPLRSQQAPFWRRCLRRSTRSPLFSFSTWARRNRAGRSPGSRGLLWVRRVSRRGGGGGSRRQRWQQQATHGSQGG